MSRYDDILEVWDACPDKRTEDLVREAYRLGKLDAARKQAEGLKVEKKIQAMLAAPDEADAKFLADLQAEFPSIDVLEKAELSLNYDRKRRYTSAYAYLRDFCERGERFARKAKEYDLEDGQGSGTGTIRATDDDYKERHRRAKEQRRAGRQQHEDVEQGARGE